MIDNCSVRRKHTTSQNTCILQLNYVDQPGHTALASRPADYHHNYHARYQRFDYRTIRSLYAQTSVHNDLLIRCYITSLLITTSLNNQLTGCIWL
jgi:hypothetical protein